MTRWGSSKCDVAGCRAQIDTSPETTGWAMSVEVRICREDAARVMSGEAVIVIALAPSALARVPGCHCVRRHGGELEAKDCPIHGAGSPA